MSPTISTRSGIEINPVASINDLLSGTAFQEDELAQEHLQSLGAAFHEISKTAEGQVLLVSMEGLAQRIKVNRVESITLNMVTKSNLHSNSAQGNAPLLYTRNWIECPLLSSPKITFFSV